MAKSKQDLKKVIHYVWINNQHLLSLVSALSGSGIVSKKSQPRISTIALLVLLSPLAPIYYRLLGYRIMHIHWVSGQFRPPRPKGAFADRFFYIWHRLFFVGLQISGLKLVWTAHNFLPHDKVFIDDLAARNLLIRNCDCVIALNEEIFSALNETFSPKRMVLISAAEPPLVPTVSKEIARKELNIAEGKLNFSALGHLRHYKGPDIFLRAVLALQSENVFTLAGLAEDGSFKNEILELTELVAAEHKLNVNLSFLSDAALANHLLATDFLVCPFRQISNSGFINLAMQMGIPLILPNLPTLGWVPKDAAIWYESILAHEALAVAISQAELLPKEIREAMGLVGKEFMQGKTWDDYISTQVALYEDLLTS